MRELSSSPVVHFYESEILTLNVLKSATYHLALNAVESSFPRTPQMASMDSCTNSVDLRSGNVRRRNDEFEYSSVI